MIQLYNEDCMKAMQKMKDNAFDLAIVDPPYGIGISKGLKFKNRLYTEKNWDSKPPSKHYFEELKRVSKNQIIFGANHFIENIPNANSSSWIVWDKKNGSSTFADCELAYTSFNKAVRKAEIHWTGFASGREDTPKKIHPTQKPVSLYTWILSRYTNEGDKILDTHLGSGSIAIACHDMKFDLTAYEIDKEYYDLACKRLEKHQRQLTLF